MIHSVFNRPGLRVRLILLQSLLMVVTVGSILSGCKKNGGQANEGPSEPVITEKGIPTGPAVQKTIGPAGGTLTSADGRLKITVAPGTVSNATEFAIEPITNTLQPEATSRTAYRLKPEGIHFAKPVRLQFVYENMNVTDSAQEDLMVAAWQTAAGAWKVEPTALNKTTETVEVETTHFSDWTTTTPFWLDVYEKVLRPSQKTEMRVLITDKDSLLVALAFPNWPGRFQVSAARWKILKGSGSLQPAGPEAAHKSHRAEYTAPSFISGPMRVEIAVELDGAIRISDPKAPNGARIFSKVVLLEEIQVIDAIMNVTLDNQQFTFTGDECHVSIDSSGLGTLIRGEDENMVVNITINGQGVNSYPCGNVSHGGKAGIEVWHKTTQGFYNHSYWKCDQFGNPLIFYSTAPVDILKFPGAGGLVQGKYDGKIYNNSTIICPESPNKPLKIDFSIPRL